VPAGSVISNIAAGGAHSLALTTGGQVLAWGSDVFGQLSSTLVGSLPTGSDVPIQPNGLPPSADFVTIAAGQYDSYALTSAGAAWTWGGNYYGQLGDGATSLDAVTPAAITALPTGTLASGLFTGPDATAAFLVTRSNQTIAFPSMPRPTYGDKPVDVEPTATSGLPITGTASGACAGALAHLYLVAAGTCTLTATQAGSLLYYPATATASFVVARATLTIVPYPATGTAGSVLPRFRYHLTGFVDGDTAAVVSGTATCTTSATAESDQGTYQVTCTVGTLTAANYVFVSGPPAVLTLVTPSIGVAVVGSDGSVATFGATPADQPSGSMAGTTLAAPIVGGAYTPLHDGYWLTASDGGVFAFGSAPFEGSMSGKPLGHPIVGMAATPDGDGYWLVASDGGVFAFGDAGYFGSASATSLTEPIVGMAATPDGGGYWLVGSDGGIFAYGDAGYYGSASGRSMVDPVVGMAVAKKGAGYWLVTRAGAVLPFGDARYLGSLRYVFLGAPIVGITSMPDGRGYWLAGADGGIFAFGNAVYYGNDSEPSAPIVGIF